MSHLLHVDRVVLGVRAHETDVNHAVRIVDLHHQPVVVAFDVEHRSVTTNDACAAVLRLDLGRGVPVLKLRFPLRVEDLRSEEHTSELQSLMRISYAVFCLKKKIQRHNRTYACSTI